MEDMVLASNMNYGLFFMNRLFLAMLAHHRDNLQVGSQMHQNEFLHIYQRSASLWRQDWFFCVGLQLVEELSNPQRLELTEDGKMFLDAGDWNNRTASIDDVETRYDLGNLDNIISFEHPRGRRLANGRTIPQHNFWLTDEQKKIILKKILTSDNVDKNGEFDLRIRVAIYDLMKFVHLEPEHWTPSDDQATITDDRIELFLKTFHWMPQNPGLLDTWRTNSGSRDKIGRNIRNLLSWTEMYCSELGLITVTPSGGVKSRWNRVAFTEKGSRVFQLLAAREYSGRRPDYITNPITGSEVAYDDEVEMLTGYFPSSIPH